MRSNPDRDESETLRRDDLVVLDPDHPGFRDPAYRERRNEIARLAQEYRTGDPAPRVDYSEAEHAVWKNVWDHLTPLHGATPPASSPRTSAGCLSSRT